MSERPTPLTDALAGDRFGNNDVRAWMSLCARLERDRAELVEALEKRRPKHYECEDKAYSCPKSLVASDECDCGADKDNAEIDALLARLKDQPQ